MTGLPWRKQGLDFCPDCRHNRRYKGGACPPCRRLATERAAHAQERAGAFLVKSVHKSIFDKAVAHIWTGEDTACRMWSTGGIQKKSGYDVVATTDLPVCSMCREARDAR